MPKDRKKRRGSKRSVPYKKKKKAAAPRDRVPRVNRSLSAFPQGRVVRHHYADAITMPAAAGGGLTQYYTIRLNSTFDPDFTGTGHQPMFRDEMAAKYSHYTVLEAKVRITIDPTYTKTKSNHTYAVVGDSTPDADSISFLETYGRNGLVRLASNQNVPTIMRRKYNIAKLLGTTEKALLADDTSKVAVGSNPGSNQMTAYLHIVGVPFSFTDTLTAHPMRIELQQTVLWRDPIAFATS